MSDHLQLVKVAGRHCHWRDPGDRCGRRGDGRALPAPLFLRPPARHLRICPMPIRSSRRTSPHPKAVRPWPVRFMTVWAVLISLHVVGDRRRLLVALRCSTMISGSVRSTRTCFRP